MRLIFREIGEVCIDTTVWTPLLSDSLAKVAGIEQLTAKHWQIIEYIREKYFQLGAVPGMRRACKKLGLSKNQIRGLFGGCRQLWQIAGLPNPGEEAKAYMD
jgi:tRNA 2-thiouridine synthesizing protein E